jgi:hypothetical protein
LNSRTFSARYWLEAEVCERLKIQTMNAGLPFKDRIMGIDVGEGVDKRGTIIFNWPDVGGGLSKQRADVRSPAHAPRWRLALHGANPDGLKLVQIPGGSRAVLFSKKAIDFWEGTTRS